ncbi:MAG: toll/interleukin-1 receptor domain-containing protein [Bacteroidia bacterium]|nr:toll/interleukin-1 receptor domain-containing protein [Bacteroidia bacterium]
MAILTRTRLTALTESKLGTRIFSETVNESKRETRTTAVVSVFLSHSHDDLEKIDVEKTIVLLRKVGVRVYIDSNDSSLPPFTSAETAKKIKEQIKLNNKFILVATNKAINSKWCNWELGFGDAQKYINHIALIPIADNSASWNGSEYLRIYPRIEESEYTAEHIKIIFPDKTEKSLLDWLKS